MFESYLFLGFLHPDYFEERVVLEVGARLAYQVSDRGDLFFFHGDDEPVIMDDMSTKNYRINPVVNDNGDEIGFTITSPEGYPGAVIGFSPDAYLMGAILVTKQFSKFDGEELPQQQLGNFGPFNLN